LIDTERAHVGRRAIDGDEESGVGVHILNSWVEFRGHT